MQILLDYQRHRTAPVFKYRALYRALRTAIERKDYDIGDRLPSIRGACRLFQLSKSTVQNAYELLCADAYLESVPRKGHFVVYSAGISIRPKNQNITLTAWGRRLAELRIGALLLSESPCTLLRRWLDALKRAFRELNFNDVPESTPEKGLLELREKVASHLFRKRRLRVSPDEVVIAGGLEQSFALLMQLLVEPGERVEVEEDAPGFVGAMVHLAGGVLRGDLREIDAKSRVFCSGPRWDVHSRFTLLERVEQRDGLLLEVDPGLGSQVTERMYQECASERVIHIGRFAGVPARFGELSYAILPQDLAGPFLAAQKLFARSPSLLEQKTVTNFLRRPGFG